ncbi:MAG: hypothetical protein AMJ38_01280 [Dehalococcoidia bacterium DG_22]|nr:MAG: hypothetical protein AMJ38_01280 [Dehalococcoidia bacterium DG_22]
MQKARLAHPRLALDQHQPSLPANGCPQIGQQGRPLLISTHQRQKLRLFKDRCGPDLQRQVGRFGPLEPGCNLLGQGHGGSCRLVSHFTDQDLAQGLVLFQRSAVAAQQVIEAHQFLVCGLAQGVGGGQPSGVGQRLLVLTPLPVGRNQGFQRVQVQLPQPLPLQQGPIVVALLEKVGAVEHHCFAQFEQTSRQEMSRQGSAYLSTRILVYFFLELCYVQPVIGVRYPCHRVSFRHQTVGGGTKGVANLPEGLGEGTAGAGVGTLGPEGAGQKVTGEEAADLSDQEGEQGTGHGRMGRRKRRVVPF